MYIASYYRQLSADIKMKNYKIKTSLVRPEGSNARANKTCINFMIFLFLGILVKLSTILYDT